ncbi:NAD(P)-dependent oxidoreductase [Bacillaceae bacterium Marseille-Q3522]|nr:NAD(P)-dependent oxidoreductase [Bacillaceae bacterium Marseille-Q3522]
MNIGWIGLGNMGNPMAANLLKAGYPVEVYNRTKAKALPLVENGAKPAEDVQQLVNNSDVIITMVSDDQAVKEVYFGENGIFTADLANKILIDMSTVSPESSQFIEEKAKENGASFLDAPVSGSVQPAKEGNLIVLVGGEEEVFQKVKQVFEPLSKLTLYLGRSGAGNNAKLAINLLLGITIQGIAETVLFAEKQGISAENMLKIITESAVGTPISKLKRPSILSNQYPAAFALKHMAKDLRLAKGAGSLLPIGDATYKTFQESLADQLGEEDVMAVIRYLQQQKANTRS